ncbi:hypothetical protein FQN49_005849 [Arthroderma sp. PD_2]|nr:hypothetical protein FQN49_005849 [Arthroderma sp. PD_2]
MKLSAIAAAALVAVVAAQDIAQLPQCAQACAGQGFPSDCGADVKCICTSESFLNAITCCVASNCTPDEQKKTIKFAKGICGGVGVSVPDSAVCPTGSGTSGSPSSTPTSAGSETGSVTGTAITGSSTPTGTDSPSGSPTESGSSPTESGASPTEPTSPPTQTGNAASTVNANGGLLAAVAALVVAVA